MSVAMEDRIEAEKWWAEVRPENRERAAKTVYVGRLALHSQLRKALEAVASAEHTVAFLRRYAAAFDTIIDELGAAVSCVNPIEDLRLVVAKLKERAEKAESLVSAQEAGRLSTATALLTRVEALYSEVRIVEDLGFWRDYYRFTGCHMILTDEGWESGSAKQSYLDDWKGVPHCSNPILEEVNAP